MRQFSLLSAVLFSFVACTSAAFAAQSPPAAKVATDAETVFTTQQLQKILQSAPLTAAGKQGDVSTQLFPGAASCSFIRLTEIDPPHVHPVSEIYVVQDGSGTLETGGTMIGPFTAGGVHHLAAGEKGKQTAEEVGPDHGGTALTGGHSREVKAGDVIMVPAGVNHHWTKVNQPLVYLDIKFPKVESR